MDIFKAPTAEEVLGPFHHSIYAQLKNQLEEGWHQTRLQLMPLMWDLAVELAAIPSAQEDWIVEYRSPETLNYTDCVGDSPHFFFLRLPNHSDILTRWGKCRKHRTAVIVAIDDPINRPNQHAWSRGSSGV